MSDAEGYVDPQTGEIHVPDDQAGTDIERLPMAPTVPAQAGSFAELEKMLGEAKDRSTQSPEEIQRSMLEKILSATTVDEVYAVQDVRHARDILGEAFEATDIRFNVSDYTDGVPFYLIVDGYDVATGDKITVTCGGATVMAQLYQLKRLGAFPAKVKFQQAKKATKQGYFPLHIEPAT